MRNWGDGFWSMKEEDNIYLSDLFSNALIILEFEIPTANNDYVTFELRNIDSVQPSALVYSYSMKIPVIANISEFRYSLTKIIHFPASTKFHYLNSNVIGGVAGSNTFFIKFFNEI